MKASFIVAFLCGARFLVLQPADGASFVYRAPAETAALSPGPNVEVAEKFCGACHSYEYITTQPRGSSFGQDFWRAEVNKMIKVFGAPIKDTDAKSIVDYLSDAYK